MGTRAETTKKEKAILKFIETQVLENGYPPSVREIGKAIGLSSTATVHAYLEKLEKDGYIKKEDKKGRTLKIIKGSNGEPYVKSSKDFYVQKELVDVPVIGRITAGQPILAVENVTDTFPIPVDFVGNSESFMLTVRGESMIEAGILDGDYILVKKQSNARFPAIPIPNKSLSRELSRSIPYSARSIALPETRSVTRPMPRSMARKKV